MKAAQLGLVFIALHAVLWAWMHSADAVHLLLSGAQGAGLPVALGAVLFLVTRLQAQLLAPGLVAAGLVWWALAAKAPHAARE